MTDRLELNWKLDGLVDEQRYYCSETPIDPENLPTRKAVLAGDVRTYVDTAIEVGKTYYVCISAVKDGIEKLSDFEIISTNDYLIDMKIEANAWVNKGSVPIVMNWTGTPAFETDAVVLNNTQWFNVPSNEVFNFGVDNFEMSFEIYLTNITFYRFLISGIYYDNRYSQLAFNETKPYMYETFGDFGTDLLASTGITANNWHVVTMRRQSPTLIEILIDNIVVASRAVSPTVTINFNPNSGGTRFFNCTWSPDTTRFNGKVRRITLKR